MVGGYDVGAAVFAAQHRVSKEDPSHCSSARTRYRPLVYGT